MLKWLHMCMHMEYQVTKYLKRIATRYSTNGVNMIFTKEAHHSYEQLLKNHVQYSCTSEDVTAHCNHMINYHFVLPITGG